MTDARLQVDIDGRGAVQGANVSVRALRNLEGQAGRVHGAFDRMQRSIFSLRGALTGLAGAFAFRELTRTLDAWTQYETRLRLVTDSTGELINVQEALFELAQDTRTEFGATVELYSRVARSADQLGLSQQNLLELTETVQQSIQIGGATAQEAAAGVVQFSQALASGELRGDEFRSLSENLQGLRNALVDGLNEIGTFGDVTIGELRELSAEGQLTTDVISGALLAVADDVEQTYGLMPRTIAQAVTQLQNDMLRVVGTLDDGSGASDRFVEAIDQIRNAINSPEFVGGMAAAVEGLAFMAENLDLVVTAGSAFVGLRLGAAFGPLGALIGTVAGALLGMSVNLRDVNTAAQDGRIAAQNYAEGLERLEEGANGAAAALFEVSQAASITQIATLNAQLTEQVAEFDRLGSMILEGRRRQTPGVFDISPIGREQIRTYETLGERIEFTSQLLNRARGQLSDTERQIETASQAAVQAASDNAAASMAAGELTEDLTSQYNDFVAAGNDAFRMQQEINAVMAEYTDIQDQLTGARMEAFSAGDIDRARELAQQLERLRLSQAAQIQQIEERYTPAVEAATGATNAFAESLGRVKGKGEEAEETVKKAADGAEEVADEWRQIGGAFASALERAIFNGEGFREVLAGIALDLARLAAQQATLAAFGGGGGGNFFGDLLGGIGSIFGLGPSPKIGVKHSGGRGDDFQRFTRSRLSGDERLTVVRNNERVLTLGQQQRASGRPSLIIEQNFHISADAANDGARLTENVQQAAAQAEAGMRAAFDRWLGEELSFGGALNQVA